jgi:hypothetical protein
MKVVLLCVALMSAAYAEPVPSADEIVKKLMAADDARHAALRDYSAVRKYSLVNSRFGVKASLTVRMTYRAPGPKQFEEIAHSGPAPLRSKIFQRMIETEQKASSGLAREETRMSSGNYNFRYVSTADCESRHCYVLDVEPKSTNPLLFRGRIYVDSEDFAVAYMDGSPAQNPSFWLRKTVITQRYHKMGEFWLPALNASNSDVRMFGHSEVKIEYTDYAVNPPAGAAVASGN